MFLIRVTLEALGIVAVMPLLLHVAPAALRAHAAVRRYFGLPDAARFYERYANALASVREYALRDEG